MTDPRSGAGEHGPGASSPGPSPFRPRRPIAFPGRSRSRPTRKPPVESPAAELPPVEPPGASPSVEPSGASPPVEPPVAGPSPVDSLRAEPLLVGPSPADSPSGAAPTQSAAPSPEIAEVAARVFGDRLDLAIAFAHLLTTDGVIRGLIGPREAPRIWERHLVNCAVVSDLFPIGASVVDVGSGAGLPGIVLAVARPDLSITLVEPLARRTAFLSEAVTTLGLEATVTVLRGRAEDVVDGPPADADVVTARAVAPLDRLAGWCLPLVRPGGRLLALKGASAADEIAEHRTAIARLGGADPVLRLCGADVIDPPTTVVEVVRERVVVPSKATPKSSSRTAGTGRDGARTSGSGRGRTRRG